MLAGSLGRLARVLAPRKSHYGTARFVTAYGQPRLKFRFLTGNSLTFAGCDDSALSLRYKSRLPGRGTLSYRKSPPALIAETFYAAMPRESRGLPATGRPILALGLLSVAGNFPRASTFSQLFPQEDTVMGEQLHATRIDLPEEIRTSVIRLLNQSLATTLDLKTQVKQAHWNVKGPQFIALHEMFDEMATELDGFVDDLAERITALGGTALGTARVAAAQSILAEYPADIHEGLEHVQALAERYAPFARHVRAAIAEANELGDADTADLYTEISRAIDKRLWFLEAHLQAAR